ncbi:MAG: hypothetical protein HY936_10325 [Nitrosomonadales bacterium]|nr:hypothetical protein [Nitrosomonadales bacterium]
MSGYQRTEDRGQRTEALSRLRRTLDITCRTEAHNNLPSVVNCWESQC